MRRLRLDRRIWVAILILASGRIAPRLEARSTGQFTVRYSFKNTPDGSFPCCGLIQATDGNFYGVTEGGGSGFSFGRGPFGTIFRMTPQGVVTVLHSFDLYPDGAGPLGIIQASDGNFYGATDTGGDSGYGTIFKLTPDGTFSVIHAFGGPDGARPSAGIIQASDGNLYGTTQEGGRTFGQNLTAYDGSAGYGTVFRLGLDGTFAVMYSFGDSPVLTGAGQFINVIGDSDGAYPQSSVVQGTDGNLYGMTTQGGPSGAGVVFKLTPDGTLAVLHNFDGADGASPSDEGLIQGADGALYGTTSGTQGLDPGDPSGEIFRLSLSGTFTVLHSFDFATDGGQPYTSLLQTPDGSLYGTTNSGGPNGDGTVFQVTADGTFNVIHVFDGSDGANPVGGLTRGADGNLYGTTGNGGANGYGTLFELAATAVPVAPTIAWQPVPLMYGTPLGPAQLDATANASGSFTYTPASGTQLPAGSQTLTVIFTPADPSHFTPAMTTVSLPVAPLPLSITAGDAAITIGAPLPGFTVDYGTFVGNDGPTSLGGSLTFSTYPAPVAGPGRYAIVPGGLSSTNYAITFVPGTLTVSYGVAVLFDQTKSVKSGATLPIKLQLVDATGADLSSSAITVVATSLTQVSTGASDAIMDAGNANPDDDFRFDATLGPTGGYVFNFKTTGLATGTYALTFNVGGDPTVHQVQFQVR